MVPAPVAAASVYEAVTFWTVIIIAIIIGLGIGAILGMLGIAWWLRRDMGSW